MSYIELRICIVNSYVQYIVLNVLIFMLGLWKFSSILSHIYVYIYIFLPQKEMLNFFSPSNFREIQDLALALQVAQTTHILGMIQVFSLQKL